MTTYLAGVPEERDRQGSSHGPLSGLLTRGVGRRSFLALAAWGVAASLLPGLASARVPLPRARRLTFKNIHTDECVDTCYWENGAYVPTALERIDTVLRDHRSGETRQISPALIDVVFAMTLLLESSTPVQVVSGYRSPATNALLRSGDPAHVAERSLHLTGEAVDLCFEDRALRRVREAALSLGAGGVGYYPASGFVHVDVGRPRSW